MRLSLLLINAGLVAVTMMLGERVSANWQYDSVYGGLTQYATPQSQPVNITRNGIGRHPTRLDYNEGAVTYDFQDNLFGQRAMRTRSTTGVSPAVSHFVFGGLNPVVEFEGSDKVHYTVAGAYISVDNNNNVQTQYVVRDRLQSTRALLDENLAVSAQFGYDTLGKPTENDQACTTSDCGPAHRYPYRFQGHQYLAWDNSNGGYQLGVTDNKDRLYSHDQGLRFMHTDSAGASIAPYTAYADDPVNIVDMNGMDPITAMIIRYWLRTQGVETNNLSIWPTDLTQVVDRFGVGTWEQLAELLSDPSIKNIFVADIHTVAEYMSLEAEILKGVNIEWALQEHIGLKYRGNNINQLKRKYKLEGEKIFSKITKRGEIYFKGEKVDYSISCLTCLLNAPFIKEAQREANIRSNYRGLNMTAKETSSSISKRQAALHEVLNETVRRGVPFSALGGENYQTYYLDMKVATAEMVKLLVFTGYNHVFKPFSQALENLFKFSNDPKYRDNPNNRARNKNKSMGSLKKFGGVGLTLRYVGKEEDKPNDWEELDVDTNRFRNAGTYKYKKGYKVDVWESINSPTGRE
jgi:hypothetical protein